MSDHTTALVPISTGNFHSPGLLEQGYRADTGLFAESLIYYDSVFVHVDNAEQLANFISTLVQRGLAYEELIDLIEDGTIKFFNTVILLPFMGYQRHNMISNFYAMEESAINEPNYFTRKFLLHEALRDSFSTLSSFNQEMFEKFCRLAQDNSLTYSNEVVSSGIVDNSYEDFLNPARNKLITQSILSELYEYENLGKVPDFDIKIRELNSNNMEEIARNLDATIAGWERTGGDYRIFEIVGDIPLKGLKNEENLRGAFRTLPLSGAGVANLYIRSAGRMNCDLFLANPISSIIGDKLFEIGDVEFTHENVGTQNLIESLETQVEFPDVRQLINTNQIDFTQVLRIRKKGKRFREWLQQTSAKEDWQIFFAYHNEVAKETGFVRGVRKGLEIFGVVASGAIGGAVGAATHMVTNDLPATVVAATTATVGSEVAKKVLVKGTEKVFDYGAKLGSNWKPVCFGNWHKENIAKLLKGKNE